MEKIQCDKCGADNFNSSKYCSSCGYELPKTIVTDTPQEKPAKAKKKMTMAQIVGIIVGVATASLASMFVQKCVFPKPDIDKVMVETVNTINKTFPMMIDADTRIDNAMALPNKTILYNYSLVNYENGMIDTVMTKNTLEPNIINNIKTSPEMKYHRDNNVTFQYRYKDKNGNYMFSIIVTPEQYK